MRHLASLFAVLVIAGPMATPVVVSAHPHPATKCHKSHKSHKRCHKAHKAHKNHARHGRGPRCARG
jgi:uncharacterized membrane protein